MVNINDNTFVYIVGMQQTNPVLLQLLVPFPSLKKKCHDIFVMLNCKHSLGEMIAADVLLLFFFDNLAMILTTMIILVTK